MGVKVKSVNKVEQSVNKVEQSVNKQSSMVSTEKKNFVPLVKWLYSG